MSKRPSSDLRQQALRLEPRAHELLSALVNELHAAGDDITAAEATRGLCMLALQLARGSAGDTVADVVRLTASDPTTPCVRRAVDTLLWLLDLEPSTRPQRSKEPTHEQNVAPMRSGLDLANQALRLPPRALDQLKSLAAELRATGADTTAAKAARGLCLFGLDLIYAAPSTEVAKAFRIAAGDPTTEGTRRALEAIQSLLDGVPSTVPDPFDPDDEPTTTPSVDSQPPSSIPNSRGA
ncbi:MAG: hypothetical protein ABJE95_33130 [Byssovorax sp.]